MTQLRILIVSENASNVFGGEAMLPLNYFRLLGKTQHEVYLITHARVKSTIQQISDIDQSRVFYVPDTWLHKFLFKHSSILPERITIATFGLLMHLITQFYQWKLARKIIREKKIDVIHEPAPVSAVQPSAMFGLGVPVVIGPMNGGMSFPPAFQYMAGKGERLFYGVMRIFASIYNLLIPGKFFAEILLVANNRTFRTLPKFRLGKVIELVENGVFSVLNEPKNSIKQAQVNVIYVGRLVDWKTVDIAIEAIGLCQQEVKLTIVGDGPLRESLMQLAQDKAPNKVEFLGLVPHSETNALYDRADISVLPSVRECGGAVVLEAMARGLPVIATDWGGPADYISSDTGFLIEPKSRAYMIEEFAKTIDKLAINPDLRSKVGAASIKRVLDYFMWDKKIETIISIYQIAIARKND